MLHVACRRGQLHTAKYSMEEYSKAIIARNLMGCTALHHACMNGHAYVVQYLLQQHRVNVDVNININARNNKGNTHSSSFGGED